MLEEKFLRDVFVRITADPRYLANLDWGEARSGHPEGTIRAHIAELERNLETIRSKVAGEYYWKLKLLIYTHDIFKAQAKIGAAISDPQSHASLARQFLAEYGVGQELLNIVQHHDEGYALWRQFVTRGEYSKERLKQLLGTIADWDLFLWFVIIDGSTREKDREALAWFIREVNKNILTSVKVDDLIYK